MQRTHHASAAVSGVLYAEDFDAPPAQVPRSTGRAAPVSEPEVIIPTYSVAELHAATVRAREEGRQLERTEAAAANAARSGAALTELAGQVAQTQQQAAAAVDKALHALAGTTLSLLAAAVPDLCRRHAAAELQALMRRVLPPLRQVPSLSIRLHPAMRPALQEQVATLLLDAGTDVTWIESATFAAGDIAVTWQNGCALRDTASIGAAIRDAVLSLLVPGTTELVEMNDDQ